MKTIKYVSKTLGSVLAIMLTLCLFTEPAAAKSIRYEEGNKQVTNKPIAVAGKQAAARVKQNTVKASGKHQQDSPKGKDWGRTYSAGESGWKIKVAQQKLKLLGFSQEQPSGKFTGNTEKALVAFQKQYKLQTSGKLDSKTYNKLLWTAFTKEGITGIQGRDIVQSASRYKGVPYAFGGTSPKGFDCSGYVQFIFKKANAVLPRAADEQVLKGLFVTQSQLKPGDLVFFTTYAPGASHVGIYAGNGNFWHTSSSKGVMLSSLRDVYWKPRYYGARRVLVSNGEV